MKICDCLQPAPEPESLSLHLYLGRDQSALNSSGGTFTCALLQPGHACFGGKHFCKSLLSQAGWQTQGRQSVRADRGPDASLKLHLIKSAHTHAHAHTQMERTDLA